MSRRRPSAGARVSCSRHGATRTHPAAQPASAPPRHPLPSDENAARHRDIRLPLLATRPAPFLFPRGRSLPIGPSPRHVRRISRPCLLFLLLSQRRARHRPAQLLSSHPPNPASMIPEPDAPVNRPPPSLATVRHLPPPQPLSQVEPPSRPLWQARVPSRLHAAHARWRHTPDDTDNPVYGTSCNNDGLL